MLKGGHFMSIDKEIAEKILTPVIKQELQRYDQCGHPYKLKASALRKKYTIRCLIGAIFCWPVALIVYICLMCKPNPVKAIMEAAKAQPDIPIEQIVAQEIIWK